MSTAGHWFGRSLICYCSGQKEAIKCVWENRANILRQQQRCVSCTFWKFFTTIIHFCSFTYSSFFFFSEYFWMFLFPEQRKLKVLVTLQASCLPFNTVQLFSEPNPAPVEAYWEFGYCISWELGRAFNHKLCKASSMQSPAGTSNA